MNQDLLIENWKHEEQQPFSLQSLINLQKQLENHETLTFAARKYLIEAHNVLETYTTDVENEN